MSNIFKKSFLINFVFCSLYFVTYGQDLPPDPKNEAAIEKEFEIFEMQEGDTTYIMKKYFLCIYSAGPNRDQEKEKLTELQTGHMNHIGMLAENKQACIAGPMAGDGEMRGIIIMSVYSKEEAVELIGNDPMVKAGRLNFEIQPFWAAKGSKLF